MLPLANTGATGSGALRLEFTASRPSARTMLDGRARLPGIARLAAELNANRGAHSA